MLQLWFYFENVIARLERDEEGQTAVEYGLMLAVVVVGLVVALKLGLAGVIDTVATKITNAINGAS
jgi:Flp pilus assembly pilin Flp